MDIVKKERSRKKGEQLHLITQIFDITRCIYFFFVVTGKEKKGKRHLAEFELGTEKHMTVT